MPYYFRVQSKMATIYPGRAADHAQKERYRMNKANGVQSAVTTGSDRHVNADDHIMAAIYCHTARSEADIEIAVQILKISEYSAQMRCGLAGIYQDIGFNGNDKDRPELNRLRRNIEDGLVNCVAVTNRSRLSRDTEHLSGLLGFFAKHGVRLIETDSLPPREVSSKWLTDYLADRKERGLDADASETHKSVCSMDGVDGNI